MRRSDPGGTRTDRFLAAVWPAIAVALVLAASYLLQLLAAGSMADGAAAESVRQLRAGSPLVLSVLAPFLHTSHRHLLQNLVPFLLFGSLLGQHTTPRRFLLFVLAAGWIGNSVLAPILGGPTGIGASAATLGVEAREVVYRGRLVAAERETPIDRLAFFGAAFLVAIAVAEIFGAVAAPGISTAAHLGGLLVGAGWEIFQPVRRGGR